MVIMDQFTRRIIGYAVHKGDCDGIDYCRMFNEIKAGKSPPKRLSSDNDPLFEFSRWGSNLRVIDVKEIKSIPATPTSHPFIERVIGTTRREFLNHVQFSNKGDLQKKLNLFQEYYNETRVHSSLDSKTPIKMASSEHIAKNVVSIDYYRWKSYCGGLYQLPISA